ncbi:DUF6545 domain-containing protein [Streptomyces sp. SS8]
MDSFTDYLDYRWSAAALVVALGAKVLTRVRFWANPLLRAVGGVLLMAIGVCTFAAPGMIIWVNDVTGVTNMAAPWVYTLLTVFSFYCLVLVLAWQRGMEQARRALRWMTLPYAAVVIAVWTLFVLADVDVERVRDFDTYYATTPYARELILLYLVAHAVACLVTSVLLWNWLISGKYEVKGWLMAGLALLALAYAANLAFDGLKLTAVVARWTGHDLDWLSTKAAPLAGAVSAVIGSFGFLVPHVGEGIRARREARAAYRRLKPLYRLLEETGALVGSAVPDRADVYLALAHRDTTVRDSIMRAAPHLDQGLWARAREEAARHDTSGQDPDRIAGAVVLVSAFTARADSPPQRTPLDPSVILNHLYEIADTLCRPGTIETIRRRCAVGTGSTPPHEHSL